MMLWFILMSCFVIKLTDGTSSEFLTEMIKACRSVRCSCRHFDDDINKFEMECSIPNTLQDIPLLPKEEQMASVTKL